MIALFPCFSLKDAVFSNSPLLANMLSTNRFYDLWHITLYVESAFSGSKPNRGSVQILFLYDDLMLWDHDLLSGHANPPQKITIVFFLHAQPISCCPKIISQVQTTCRTHSTKHRFHTVEVNISFDIQRIKSIFHKSLLF